MDEIEVPKYFICPISLYIMKDPVTTVTGITYDRESIEKWLSENQNVTCPVTNQAIPAKSDLTPNHTLRRLIQGWCVAKGVDRIPTPRPPLDARQCLRLAREARSSLGKIECLARESDKNRKLLGDCGLAGALVEVVVSMFREGDIGDVEDALRTLYVVSSVSTTSIDRGEELMESIGWALREGSPGAKAEAMKVLKLAVKEAEPGRLERLRLDLFLSLTAALREMRTSEEGGWNKYSCPIKAGIEAMAETSHWGRNRGKIVEAGAVLEAVEVLLVAPAEDRKAAEVAMGLVAELCACAEGRERLVGHPAGIAALAKRVLRVSPAADEAGLRALWLVARSSAKAEILTEMLAVGAVAKLCMVMQADCDVALKDMARLILRLHSKLWSHSPCVAVYFMSMQR